MKFKSENHRKVSSMPYTFRRYDYPLLALTKINVAYNGGVRLHKQYLSIISKLTKDAGCKSKYGAQLFIYMVELCRQRCARGFKVALNKSLYTSKGSTGVTSSYSSWVDMLEFLVSTGYGILYIGDSYKTEGKVEYSSVFELTDKAFNLVENKSTDKAPRCKFNQDKVGCVITTIKDGKKEVEVDTKGVRVYKNFVNEINAHNLKFKFQTKDGVVFDPQLTRKFSLYKDKSKNNNLSMFQSYGRYIGVFQGISPKDRLGITIDDESVVEGDYSSNHAFIVYEIENVVCDGNFKPYLAGGCGLNMGEGHQRSLYKIAMMMMFNAKRPEQALHKWVVDVQKSITTGESEKGLYWKGVSLPDYQGCKAICDTITEHNKAISGYFGGYANLLQNLDSCIATEVMRILKGYDVPFLCIHDSFIVPKSKSNLLEYAMTEGWRIVLGSSHNCRISFK